MSKKTKTNKSSCWHDCKNAIEISEFNHVCRLCNKQIDPFEWFFTTYMESIGAVFIDVTPQEDESVLKVNKKPRKTKLIKTDK